MSNQNGIFELIEKEYKECPEDFAGPINDDEKIKLAEKTLKVNFSNSYVYFIKKFGSAVIPGHIIYGLNSLNVMGDSAKNVIDKTNFYKNFQKWPGIENWYIISDDGMGNPIGIDSEGKVWISDHDCDFELIKLADSFEEFLYKVYTGILYE